MYKRWLKWEFSFCLLFSQQLVFEILFETHQIKAKKNYMISLLAPEIFSYKIIWWNTIFYTVHLHYVSFYLWNSPKKNKKEKVYGKIASDCCSWNLTGCYRKMLYFSVKCSNKIICIISFWNQKSALVICYTIH